MNTVSLYFGDNPAGVKYTKSASADHKKRLYTTATSTEYTNHAFLSIDFRLFSSSFVYVCSGICILPLHLDVVGGLETLGLPPT